MSMVRMVESGAKVHRQYRDPDAQLDKSDKVFNPKTGSSLRNKQLLRSRESATCD